MGNEFKLNYEKYSELLNTYSTNAGTIDSSSFEVETPDSKNVVIENYVDMLNTIMSSTVSTYKTMIATNVSQTDEVAKELKEMDEDLQNNY